MPDNEFPMQIQLELPPEREVGVFADLANVWHTPNTFVLDFLTITRPQTRVGEPPTHSVLPARVATRVRIPSEQIFPLIAALQEQGQKWLAETGRVEPPESWFRPEDIS